MEWRIKRKYFNEEGNLLEIIRKFNFKVFFLKFSRRKVNKVNVLFVDLYNYFKFFFCIDYIVVGNDMVVVEKEVIFEELESDIFLNEIEDVIKILKLGKSYGLDGIINEYFIEFKDILVFFVYIIFNVMFIIGYFLYILCEFFIVLIYKKGGIIDFVNYRGISLISCMIKFFILILNKRFMLWVERNDVIIDV